MSDHETNEHHDEPGGHELDVMPNRHLFNLVAILTVLTLLACIELINIFNDQTREIGLERANKGSFLLAEYRKEMREVVEGYGPTTEPGKFFVPHARAKELVLKDPSRFRAAEPPEGWVSPDALEGGAGAAPAAGSPAQAAGDAETAAPAKGGDGATPEGEPGAGPGQEPAEGAGAKGRAREGAGQPSDTPAAGQDRAPAPADHARDTAPAKPAKKAPADKAGDSASNKKPPADAKEQG